MSDAFIVREAVLEDLPILLQFEQELIKAERPFDVTIRQDPVSYYDIKQMIIDSNACVLVVEINNTIVSSGYAIVKKARHYLDHENYSYLGFMFTVPEFRGKGLNARIIERLKEWSFDRGLNEIRLTVYEDNIPAVKAYEKVGFKKHIIEMRIA
ncbi:GNAT family N-acetyltransferase [Muricauda sp. 2012CJ35-5]|uniref:GNAT family N-acetyltransferase n=1 Tax=Flagellimonas spongiicola TaxID=2942208 RepID=A0ABT0PV02_9FLAO|nr:GNAT family N-acetyltransferase [Allomuricauda spongiicola]MCL6275185.1 GNAT family N-acetyltransferase [Allomuricauda spongiicola]